MRQSNQCLEQHTCQEPRKNCVQSVQRHGAKGLFLFTVLNYSWHRFAQYVQQKWVKVTKTAQLFACT